MYEKSGHTAGVARIKCSELYSAQKRTEMSSNVIKRKTDGKIIRLSRNQLGIKSIAALALLVLLTWEGRAVLSSMQRSLRLCAGTIIPALFPYLAASELLVSSGAGERLASRMSAPIRAVFCVSPCGAVVYVMGILCGFPVGASMAAAYARLGKISREELTHLLCFCNVPSMAFVVNAVGVSLYGRSDLGWRLWGISLISAAIVGVMYRCIFYKELRDQGKTASEYLPRVAQCEGNPLSRAAMGMLSVVSTVLFFGALLGALGAALQHLPGVPLGGWPQGFAMLSAMLEMSSGVAAISALPGAMSPVWCAAALGWGGLSVHYQLLSASGDMLLRRSTTRFFIARLSQALLCAVGIWLLEI